MVDYIRKLYNKYVVLKVEDINRFSDIEEVNSILETISNARKVEGKHDNKYIVLNREDELNIDYLLSSLERHKKHLKTPYITVDDIAVDVVNAIIVAGNP